MIARAPTKGGWHSRFRPGLPLSELEQEFESLVSAQAQARAVQPESESRTRSAATHRLVPQRGVDLDWFVADITPDVALGSRFGLTGEPDLGFTCFPARPVGLGWASCLM